MSLLRPSRNDADPLSDILSTLGPRNVRCTRLAASGRWALSFPALPRLKFVAVLRGACWLSLGGEPHVLGPGDSYMLGNSSFTTASGPDIPVLDGMPFYEAAGQNALVLGGDEVTMIGGSVVFAEDRMRFLLDALPPLLLMRRSSRTETIASTLIRLEAEMQHGRDVGHDGILQRLTDVLLIEAVRAHLADHGSSSPGWLSALADRQVGEALRLLHGAVAQPWTVATLAARVGMSRSAFAARFTRLVGRPPLGYLHHRRMSLAQEALLKGPQHIGALAAALGYDSQSAFTQAYKRTFGHPPSRRGARQPA